MKTQRVRITIDTKGNPTLACLEGFEGENCLSQTKELEMVLGGTEVDGGKTPEYYDGGNNPISINIQ
jgi:hypothetical protein